MFMKRKLTFCKSDGQIKQYYMPICNYIVKAERKEHEIMIGRSDKIVEKYTCFTTPRIILSAKDRHSYVEKIREICSCFDVTTREWYSGNELIVELHGENLLTMFFELKNMLGGVDNIR